MGDIRATEKAYEGRESESMKEASARLFADSQMPGKSRSRLMTWPSLVSIAIGMEIKTSKACTPSIQTVCA